MNYSKKEQLYISAIMGLVVGDALGVPVEFMSREELKKNPVTEMRAYGTHNQPAGTWSDDSSMVMATLEWLSELENTPMDYKNLMDKFSAWLMYGDYTPYGNNFDCGITTSRAIINYGRGIEPTLCGGKREFDNGNGSLMRILPVALWNSSNLSGKQVDNTQLIYDVSSLTHGHARSKIGCLVYAKLIADMMHFVDSEKLDIVTKSLKWTKEYLEQSGDEEVIAEIEHYKRLWDINNFKGIKEEDVRSSGYVVDTLEAAVWCFLNTDCYKECVLKAVNLGEDTDTVGAIAGGLAGLHYGYDDIPKEWVEIIPRKEWILDLVISWRQRICTM